MPQIEFNQVTKSYLGFTAVENLTFSIEPGEFLFLIGPSGAGKSTVVKMLVREELPTSGDIIFNSQSILTIPQKQLHLLRRKIGVVFQDFKILESRTVFENVAIALEVVDANQFEISEIVPNVLNLVGLQTKTKEFPSKLSGGEKQRLAIARALAHEPDVLVADEPTGMIDPQSAEDIIELLEKINSLGTTVLMTTHNQDIVNRLKKRVMRLDLGKLVSDKQNAKYHQ